MWRHLINFILMWLPPSRCFAFRAILLRSCGVDVGSDAKVCGRGWLYGRGTLRVGNGTWLSPQVVFYTHPGAPIDIGDACDIGHDVQFVTGSHEIGPGQRRAGREFARAISIGRGTWIGTGARILGGSNVGEGCVIAAGAVVVGDIPSNSLAAGIPAIVKRSLP